MYTCIMRKDQLRTYKSTRDKHLKVQLKLKRINEAEALKIKDKRKKFRDKQKAILEKQTSKRTTKRNFNTLSKTQLRKQEKNFKKLNKLRTKYKYQKQGGDVALKEILKGVEWIDNFVSSNVWKFKRKGNNLLVMFLDGSVYLYFNAGDKFIGLLNTGSKGKWIWKSLRRKNINYVKIK